MIFKALDTPQEWEWVSDRAHTILCGDMCGIVVTNEGGDIQAVAVFDSFTKNACNVHLAIENPMVIKHGFLSEIARHLFLVRNRSRIFGLVPSNNSRALKLDKHIGMREIACIPNALDEGVDYVVLEMTREECTWLPQLKEAANA